MVAASPVPVLQVREVTVGPVGKALHQASQQDRASPETWLQAQAVLAAHTAGEKDRIHPHATAHRAGRQCRSVRADRAVAALLADTSDQTAGRTQSAPDAPGAAPATEAPTTCSGAPAATRAPLGTARRMCWSGLPRKIKEPAVIL